MDNALKNNNSKFILIGKINGLAAQSKRTRRRLQKAKDVEKSSSLATRKYVVSYDVRHHLLAYAFLRGVPYSKVETNCSKFNKPRADFILKIVDQHAPYYVRRPFKDEMRFVYWKPTLNDVAAWLSSSEGL